MTVMAAACGILIVLLGIVSAGRAPSEIQALTEVTCLVGGLILCFVAVMLARLKALSVRLDGFEAVAAEQAAAYETALAEAALTDPAAGEPQEESALAEARDRW